MKSNKNEKNVVHMNRMERGKKKERVRNKFVLETNKKKRQY